ncbi:deoxyribodipyrimidine photo-lyase [Deinococcus misasensis]|uniref:deoxyribodipyrimidine photo-lyase n=1 Tax=Deinococcus misasensis TaxID=392413 RepID=UPI00068D415B|nr:deoxyribodipyrimidine photo-lyase [Deinococcus misasensis]
MTSPNPSKAMVWIHGDSLSITDPALQACPEAPAVFVFDEVFLSSHAIAFHRLAFMYQGVRDIARARQAEVALCRGSMVQEILQFAQEKGADMVHVTRAPTAEFRRTLEGLKSAHLDVVVHEPERLTVYSRPVRRFFPFWKEVQAQVYQDAPLWDETQAPF